MASLRVIVRVVAGVGFALLAAACAPLPTANDSAASPAAVAVPDVAATVALPPPAEPPAALAVEQANAVSAEPEAPPTSLWVRIRKGFRMSDIDNPLVRDWEDWYASRPDYVARMVDRSRRILFHVLEEVERRHMPSEIALLPMIESAYNPQAYSRAHASGMWQFISSTAKLYGLRQNWWYDGRRDIVAATNAALDYLEKLYGMFGSWELALASYNWGEGAVSRAVAQNEAKGLPTDYESLAMPAETRNYLPKLQAVKNIISDPARYGLAIADIPNEPYFATVTTPQHIDVQLAAKFAGISIDEFRFLNPAHNKPVINANPAEVIVLPKDKIETFQRNLENHTKPLVSWQAHMVKPGEKPEKIAARYGMSLAKLKHINGITGRTRIRTGQPLLVPVKAGTTPNMPDLPAPTLSVARTAQTRYVPPSRRGALVRKAGLRRTVAKKSVKSIKVTKAAPAKRVKVTLRTKPTLPKRIELAEKQ